MKIQTASGEIIVNKRTARGKFLMGYTTSSAFTGNRTIAAAWSMAKEIKQRYHTISWRQTGMLTAACFVHKPNNGFLEEITGIKKDRY